MIFQTLIRTITEIVDSKKAAYAFIATATAIILHLKFGVDPANALLLVSPLGVVTVAQAHIDAKLGAAKAANVQAAISIMPTKTNDGSSQG